MSFCRPRSDAPLATQLRLLQTCPTQGATRVLALRHAKGWHNCLGGAASVLHRDADLSSLGRRQASMARDLLLHSGASDVLDLVVVSPFTRTLETAAGLLAGLPKTV